MGSTDWLAAGYRAYFVTLTAPGFNDHDVTYQGKRPKGKRPACRCHEVWRTGVQLGDWNRQESAHWNRLRTALRRVLPDLEYIGSVEVQDGKRRRDGKGRGLLHRHLVVVTRGPVTHGLLQPLALAAGYGCMVDVEELQSASKAARYLSKYVVKSTTERGEVHWRAEVLVEDDDGHPTGELRVMETTPTFRTWSASQGWGVSLKDLRSVARLQAIARAQYLRDLTDALAAEAAVSPTAVSVPDSGDPPDG